MKVNILSQKLIKPCTPTPPNLRTYKISYWDVLAPAVNMGIILYYTSKPEKISQLEESLAKILPQFYLLAGRYIKKDRVVDCSDEGAEFVLAEAVDVELCDFVEKSLNLEELRGLLPYQYYQVDEAAATPLLSVQITGFKCGGVAICISISHRIFDLCSMGTFIAAWRNANNPAAGGGEITPNFDGPSLLPAAAEVNQAYLFPTPALPEFVVKRFVFNKQAIASLRSKLKPNSSNGRAVSRVRVVSALMSNALIRLDRAKHRGISRACVITQVANIRERTIPAMPDHSCGNFVWLSSTPVIAADETKDIGIQDLVDVMSKAMERTIHDCSKILSTGGKIIDDCMAESVAKLEGDDSIDEYSFSDCTKFGFYRADFGWGKPVWAFLAPLRSENLVVLTESKEDDGIEAWLHLNENDVSYFEQDEDISMFATSL